MSSPSSSHDPHPRPYQYHRPQELDSDLFVTTDGAENPLPSPPYRPVASTSNVFLDSYSEQSPAYRSRPNLAEHDMTEEIPLDEKHPDEGHKGKQHAVHYPDDIPRPATVKYDPEIRPASRASSIATDEEYSDNEYDWSGEEDLVDEEAKFEHAMGVKKKERGFGCGRLFSFLFSTLIGSTIVSAIIVAPALIVHFYWYKPNPTEHRAYVKDNVEAWLFWAAANVSISWGLGLIVDVIPIVARIVISIVWGHVSEAIKSRIELYNSVKGPIKPVLYAASCWVSWVIIFNNIFQLYDMDDVENSEASYTPRLYEAIEFLFFFALVVCAQRMLSHFIAFSFHRTAYKERLEEVGLALRTIEKLRVYRPKRRHAAQKSSLGLGRSTPIFSTLLTPAFEKDHFLQGRSHPGTPSGSRAPSRSGTPELGQDSDDERDATLVTQKQKGKARTSWFSHPRADSEPSATEDGRKQDIQINTEHRYPPSPLAQTPTSASPIRNPHRGSDSSDEDAAAIVQQAATHAAKAFKTAILHDARGIQNHTDELGGLVWNVNSSHEAKRLARSIYNAFREPGRNYLVPRDFWPAFATHDEAERAFKVFDNDGNGDISRAEIKTTLMKVYKERRFLSRSMRDVGQALSTLNTLLFSVAMIILFFIALSVFGVNIESSLTSLYTIGIGASFVFKASASNAFDAIMFLFVTHPFDTGDRCIIDEENLVVKKMTLFATIFTRADGTETYYFNSQLFSKFIINVRRSDKTAENLTMQVAWRTPMEKLEQLEKCMCNWLQTEENRWFQPSTSVTLQNIQYQRYLEITIGIPYNSNWQDWGLHNTRRTAFHAAVNYYCRQLGIVAYNSAIPIAYTDRDTLEVVPPEYGGAYGDEDADVEPPESPAAPAPAPREREREREREKTTWLGFQPPPEDGIPNGMRRRRAKSKKAMYRTFGGADGF